MAMENPLSMKVFNGKIIEVNDGFSIAMFDSVDMYIYIYIYVSVV